MRRYIGYLGLALALLVPAAAKTQVFDQRSYPMAVAWDMDGEGADADQVVTSSSAIDDASYTVAANPDACRLLDVTFTDADSSITAGTLTVVGTDCYGDPLTATYDASSPINGVQSFTVGSVSTANNANLASGAYFKTVTSVSWGTITGEDSADLLTVGYSGTATFRQYPMYGHIHFMHRPPYRYVVPGFRESGRGVTITASGTTWTASGGAGFTGLGVDDLIRITLEDGSKITTKVTTYTSSSSIVVADTIPFPTAGIKGFEYAKFLVSSDPQDGWFSVDGWDSAFLVVDVDAMVESTTGIESIVQCVPYATTGSFDDSAVQVDLDSFTAAGNAVTSIDLRLASAYSYCRVGMDFDSGDDADAADEDINISLGLRK
jgi:hypothetical protein